MNRYEFEDSVSLGAKIVLTPITLALFVVGWVAKKIMSAFAPKRGYDPDCFRP
jgi:hypothetical protein